MSLDVFEDLLESLGIFSAPRTTPEEQNALRYPIANPPRVVHGTLAHTQGGLVTDGSLRPRVSVILGHGATLRGVADRLVALYPPASEAANVPEPPTARELARALLHYSETYLPAATMAGWQSGLRLPLPIEIDTANGDWIVNAGQVRIWSVTLDSAHVAKIDDEVAGLVWPNPATLRTEVGTFLSGRSSSDTGMTLFARAARNPFESVLFTFEVLAQLPAADVFPVALAFMDAAVQHQVSLLATLTAGGAILRLIERRLATPPATLTTEEQASLTRARTMLDTALYTGVAPARLAVPRRELSETAGQLTWRGRVDDDALPVLAEPAGGRRRVVLGRELTIGGVESEQVDADWWNGAAYLGWLRADDVIAASRAEIDPGSDPVIGARLTVVERIARNEGEIDAVRMRDKGMISVGIHQWSAHSDNELRALLDRFKTASPDEYDLYFGMYGLDVEEQAANAGHFDLIDRRGAAPVTLAYTEATRMACSLFRFFDGQVVGGVGTFGTDWAGRARAAAVASHRYRMSQIHQALARFDRIHALVPTLRVRGTTDSGSTAWSEEPLEDVIDSEFGAALILDSHINKPGRVRPQLRAAAQFVGVQPTRDARDLAICNRYHDIRDTFDTTARNGVIDAAGLATAHGSFGGWL